MKKKGEITNIAASVRDKLRNIKNETNEDYNVLLTRYCIERLLFRISASKYKKKFVLKGALLFSFWHPLPHRVTRDVDLLGFVGSDVSELLDIFNEILKTKVVDDGVAFDVKSLAADPIRAEEKYQGFRVTLIAEIGTAKIPIQVDVGFGDAQAASSVEIKFPSLLGMPEPLIDAYRMETSIAEKYEALVSYGMLNSRMKDYFDFWFLAKNFPFDGAELTQSIKATFNRRGKVLPLKTPAGLTEKFWSDKTRQTIWKAFWSASVKTDPFIELKELVQFASEFLWPPALAAAEDKIFTAKWTPGGPWKSDIVA